MFIKNLQNDAFLKDLFEGKEKVFIIYRLIIYILDSDLVWRIQLKIIKG